MRRTTGLVSVIILQLVAGSVFAQMPSQGQGVAATTAPGPVGPQAPTGTVEMNPIGDKTFDVGPRWIRTPTPRAVGLVYPSEALRTGRGGSAQINCTLTIDGALSNCAKVTENPAGMGFGDATLILAPDLNIHPATKNGQPVATQVSITASYVAPSGVVGTYLPGSDVSSLQKVLTRPLFDAAPSYAQVVAAYPSRARSEKVSGRVSLNCTVGPDGYFLDPCLVTNEEPAGYGFGAAASALSRQFKVSTSLPGGGTAVGASYKLPVTFSARMLQAGGTVAGTPNLITVPSNQDLGAAFPKAARAAGVSQARSSLECTVAPGGYLTACSVVVESPPGYGVAMGAMQLASKYRVSQWSDDGLPVVGSRVRVPANYNLTVR